MLGEFLYTVKSTQVSFNYLSHLPEPDHVDRAIKGNQLQSIEIKGTQARKVSLSSVACIREVTCTACSAVLSVPTWTGTMPPAQKMCNACGGRPHLADVAAFGMWGGRIMKNCRTCAAKAAAYVKKNGKKAADARAVNVNVNSTRFLRLGRKPGRALKTLNSRKRDRHHARHCASNLPQRCRGAE